jgi:hypothetical protein
MVHSRPTAAFFSNNSHRPSAGLYASLRIFSHLRANPQGTGGEHNGSVIASNPGVGVLKAAGIAEAIRTRGLLPHAVLARKPMAIPASPPLA